MFNLYLYLYWILCNSPKLDLRKGNSNGPQSPLPHTLEPRVDECSLKYSKQYRDDPLLFSNSLWRSLSCTLVLVQRLCRAGPRGRARGRTTLGVHPLSWLLSNNRLEKVPFVSVPHTSSNRLLLSNQDKGCTPSVAHSLALPLGPALHNVLNV